MIYRKTQRSDNCSSRLTQLLRNNISLFTKDSFTKEILGHFYCNASIGNVKPATVKMMWHTEQFWSPKNYILNIDSQIQLILYGSCGFLLNASSKGKPDAWNCALCSWPHSWFKILWVNIVFMQKNKNLQETTHLHNHHSSQEQEPYNQSHLSRPRSFWGTKDFPTLHTDSVQIPGLCFNPTAGNMIMI